MYFGQFQSERNNVDEKYPFNDRPKLWLGQLFDYFGLYAASATREWPRILRR